MIHAHEFVNVAEGLGFSFWTGVPCSYLTPFINYVLQSPTLTYIGASSEGEAVGIAAGGYLAGRKTVVICQNSGLGNAINPLTSLNYPFRIPTLMIVTHRGAPGYPDEPQHQLMGQITTDLLTTMGIPWAQFPTNSNAIAQSLSRANEVMSKSSMPLVFIMEANSVSSYPLGISQIEQYNSCSVPKGRFLHPTNLRLSRVDAINIVRGIAGHDSAIIASTGKIGRELYALGHRENQLYVVGSMGCASGVGLGIHEASNRCRVVVLDGDGAVLMKMGALGTIGNRQPARFIHVVLDNEVHESTGGQATSSRTMDFATIAYGCGYRHSWRVDSADAIASALESARCERGPHMIHIKIASGSNSDLARPNVTPEQVKQSFVRWLSRCA